MRKDVNAGILSNQTPNEVSVGSKSCMDWGYAGFLYLDFVQHRSLSVISKHYVIITA